MVFLMVLAAPFGGKTIMSLTHIQITHAKPTSKAYKLADADALYLAGTLLLRLERVEDGGALIARSRSLSFPGHWPKKGAR